ncbi:MAG: hypothetical protein WA876_06170 [Candidatus Acidiferrales bacterium]
MKTKTQSGIALATTLIVMFLVVALVIGFSWMVLMDQRLGGVNGAEQYTFYGAEAGLEKLTGDLATLFASNSSPSGAQVNAIAVVANAPIIQGIQYLNPNGSLGYQIAFPQDGSGNPLATDHLIQSGNYQGMTGLLTPYTLTVTSTNPVSHSEVRLTRNVQTVAIPVFQFGMFSQTDLSFFPGPDFDFGGNVMTNGNLFLASGADLVFNGKVLSAKDVIVTNLSNGNPASNGYTGSVYIPTTTGGCPTSSYPSGNTAGCVALTQGSLVGTVGSAPNGAFPNLAKSTYNSYVGSSETNVKPVNLSITLNAGANPIDLIRRGLPGEAASNPNVLAQRYYSQASMRILLSDNPNEITGLPCVSATAPTPLTGSFGTTPVPIAESYSSGTYTPAPGNGYWPKATNTPLVTGYIKIEIQTTYAVSPAPCGTWKDVTAEVLGFGIAGKNINPSKTYTTYGYTYLPPLTGTQLPYQGTGSACADPSPNAIIRLERVRDNPSTYSSGGTDCGFQKTTGLPSTTATDYWPNALFDAREGNSRDITPTGTIKYGATTYSYANMPTPAGVMDYTELDITDLAKYFMGTIGTDGTTAKDPVNSTNDFVVYFSDRRGNYTSAPVAGWPPASPASNETGEYGFEDSINPSSAWGCPNSTLDTPETLDMVENPAQVVGGTPEDYGEQSPMWATPTSTTPVPVNAYFPTLLSTLISGYAVSPAITTNPNCATPKMPWPGAYIVQPQEARENMPIFFRRALKIVNGSSINLGTCPDGEPCGLTIVSENPVYVQGDFNAPAGNNGNAAAAHVATSIVADAVTLLSDNWNDVNSFSSLYSTSLRNATTTNYRFGAVAGKGISFPQPSTCGTVACYQDFGTDGGVHNFLRFLEDWNPSGSQQTIYYRGSVVSFYYNRQAIGVYKDGLDNTVYNPPSRGYQFDSDFLTPSLLPPRTPMFRDVNTVGFTQVVLPTP